MGLKGQQFTDKHSEQVEEMKRSFLGFMKSARVRINDPAFADTVSGADADNSPHTYMKMTADGFPILPEMVLKPDLSKKVCEGLLRTYLTQHYCELFV